MPSFTLRELASAEDESHQALEAMTGTIDERAGRLDPVFRRYIDVFLAYVSLAAPPSSDIEALKRAMFLAWYELSEPPFLTGIGDLPTDARHRVLTMIEALVPSLDVEFRWMLAWYYMITDFAFPNLGSYPELAALLRSENPDGWRQYVSATDRMRGRGLMGDYWLSVFEAESEAQRLPHLPDDTDDIATLREGLRSPHAEMREHCASIIGDRGPEALAAMPELEALLRDPVRRVRARAKWALETIARRHRR